MRHMQSASSRTNTGGGHHVARRPRKGPRLLWVDDSQTTLELYKEGFENLGFQVKTTSSPRQALHHLSSQAADVAILDYEMPEMNGVALASRIKSRHPHLPIILYSGSCYIPQEVNGTVDAICSKGAPRKELIEVIKNLSQKRQEVDDRRSCLL